ncbi:riboflavin biosynthesis protein RibF [Fervidibacillus halotolerans]|uniref:Riboflavin biosynthesis protein n=1 Tax=Fervidibacillus halotolerans TaxID=2980027 RepID=A0A9E8RY88_9BACI|nr:riboflavin biosynthesis protein RibF [Fervidibacillus halotolerans]WAA13560.1 riboflavin biosynthesis protein RibF [Fervidibacillus halotolerans]
MKVIYLTEENKNAVDELPPLSLAIGYFDGIHIGHQKVIGTAKEEAEKRGLHSGVMTFDPSPKAVLGNPEKVKYLTLLHEKKQRIQALGIDYFIIVPFTKEFSKLSPEQFIEQYIVQLNVKHLVAGFDYTYGRYGKGNMNTIKQLSENRFSYTVIEKMMVQNEKISSTSIRNLIKLGNVDQVPAMLGRHYTISGTVVHGEKRGRTIGFPTANIDVDHRYVLPKDGVYAVEVFVNGQWIPGVCNIGFKPTFHNERRQRMIEVHLLNFQDDLYGESVNIKWYKRIREERKFTSVDELSKQITRDKKQAMDFFNSISSIDHR